MKTWEAIIATATQSPRVLGKLAAVPEFGLMGRDAKPKAAFVSILGPMADRTVAAWRWLERKRTQQLTARRLRVAETISLGEKRFVSILQVDGTQFLIGGSSASVSLLAILNKEPCTGTSDASNAVEVAEAGS